MSKLSITATAPTTKTLEPSHALECNFVWAASKVLRHLGTILKNKETISRTGQEKMDAKYGVELRVQVRCIFREVLVGGIRANKTQPREFSRPSNRIA